MSCKTKKKQKHKNSIQSCTPQPYTSQTIEAFHEECSGVGGQIDWGDNLPALLAQYNSITLALVGTVHFLSFTLYVTSVNCFIKTSLWNGYNAINCSISPHSYKSCCTFSS